jgi:hypothetical protein
MFGSILSRSAKTARPEIPGARLVPRALTSTGAPAGSLKSPLLLLRSTLVYVFFMPTFVAWFSAYSTNRLSDITWGNRGESGMKVRAAEHWSGQFAARLRCNFSYIIELRNRSDL